MVKLTLGNSVNPAGYRQSLLLTTAIVTLLIAMAGMDPAYAQSVSGSGTNPTPDGSSNWVVGGSLSIGSFSPGGGTLTILDGGTVSSTSGNIGNGNTGTVTVSGYGSNASTWTNDGSLNIGLNGGTGALTIDGGAVVNNTGQGFIGRGGTGTVIVSGTDGNGHVSTWNLIVGSLYNNLDIGTNSTGTLRIEGGGWVGSGQARIGFNQVTPGSAVGTVIVSGGDGAGNVSTWENTSVYLGSVGTGTLTIEDGGVVKTSGNSFVGYDDAGNAAGAVTGTAIVTGAGSTWSSGAGLTIGQVARGILRIEAGGLVSNVTGTIGASSGSEGTVTVSGTDGVNASTWTNTGNVVVGKAGTGSLVIEDGGTVNNIHATIGDGPLVNGTVLVSGDDSAWASTGVLYVGAYGEGTLTIENGGEVISTQNGSSGGNSTAAALIGRRANSHGTVTVSGVGGDGIGSNWSNVGGDLVIGQAGIGMLTIEGGGTVDNEKGWIGAETGSQGTVEVLGEGSTWANSSALLIGEDGTGTLTIEDGGTVSSGGGTTNLGHHGGGIGTVIVSGVSNGTASSWTNDGDVAVGSAGTGTLTIKDGGIVKVAGAVQIGENISASGSLNLSGSAAGGRGVLETGSVVRGLGTATVNLNGGILRANQNQTNFLDGFTTLEAGTESAWFNTNGFNVGIGTAFTGTSSLHKLGSGTLTLTGNSTYTGGTAIDAGVLQLGTGANGGTTGSIAGDVTNNGSLVFNRSNTVTFGGRISGSGTLVKNGTGSLTLTADNDYAGDATVNAGTLIVNGDQSAGHGQLVVAGGATLAGSGTIGGDVIVGANGILAPGNSPGTLTIGGELRLAGTSILNFEFGEAGVEGGQYNDLVNVHGDLTLDGTLNVSTTAGRTFGPGVYRVINYGGALTNNELDLAGAPTNLFVQTSVANQVNLVNTAGMTLNFWDGFAGPKNDGAIQGGDGTWQLAGADDNWTDMNGTLNAPYQDGSFAIFGSIAGTVTVDDYNGNVTASGMQFASDGYLVDGDAITLLGPQADINVGDGTAPGAGYTATIAAELTGTSELVKGDLGTLVLTGTNSYTGGTAINGGTLAISADANLGAAAGGLSFDGGTLNTTANFATARAVDLVGAGTWLADAGTTATLAGDISGAGSLTKAGAGRLVITGNAGHAGGTSISGGTLQIGDGGTVGSIAGNVANSGVLAFDHSNTLVFGGAVSGSGALSQIGAGTTVLTGANSYSGGTTIAAGTLQLGNGGLTGGIAGNVTNNAALAFDRSDAVIFSGAISGTGAVSQKGTGTTILTAANSYLGTTNVNAGTLLVNGNQSGATGDTTVDAGAALGGIGIIGGNLEIADGGEFAPGELGSTPGTLTVNGNLVLHDMSKLTYDFGQAGVVGGPLNDLATVHGDLTLDGKIDVVTSPGGTFDPGIYRIISYDGDMTVDNTLDVNSAPSVGYLVQTSVAHQVNLVNTAGLTLNYWDGLAGGEDNSLVDGGTGIWELNGTEKNWTETTGGFNAEYADGSFAIFAGAPGIVTVDNGNGAVTARGMQFATDGYTITGNALTLVGTQATIRVGDSTAAGAGYTATIAAELTGAGGVAKTDLGTLVLTGTNSYTGATDVLAGKLVVDGAIASSAVLVHSGGTLSGSGTVGATTIASGGTIAPATGMGTITVNGDYVQQAGSIYQAEVDPSSTSADRIAVNGAATLDAGASVNVVKITNAPYIAGTRYTILSATDGLRGTFDLTGQTDVTAFIRLTGEYDANNAYLVAGESRTVGSVGDTPNQIETGNGVDSLPPSDPVKTAVTNLPDVAAANAALDQLSGEIHASVGTASIENSHLLRDAAIDRLRESLCAIGAEPEKRQGKTAANRDRQSTADCALAADRPIAWSQALGSWGYTASDGNAAALDRSSGGFIAGVDAPAFGSSRVGAFAGIGQSTIDIEARNSSATVAEYYAGIYGGTQWGNLGLRGGMTYTAQDIGTKRHVAFAGFNDDLAAAYNAGITQFFGDLGYRIDTGAMAFEPFANLAYINVDTDGFTEHGGGAALTSTGGGTDTLFTTIGLRGSMAFDLDGTSVVARGSLGWRHAVLETTPTVALAFPEGSSFDIAGASIAQDALVFNAGLDIAIGQDATLGLSYAGQFARGTIDQSVRGVVSARF